MGYLTLSRHSGEMIRLTIDPGVDTEALLKHLLRDGITLHVGDAQGGKVRIGIDAPKEMLILRDEMAGFFGGRPCAAGVGSASQSEDLTHREAWGDYKRYRQL